LQSFSFCFANFYVWGAATVRFAPWAKTGPGVMKEQSQKHARKHIKNILN
jgi:hypothetical protein